MAERILSLTYETKEEIKLADTDYLKKQGVERVGHRKVFKINETDQGIQICGGSATRYYFLPEELDAKSPEELPWQSSCITLPKELLPELKGFLDKHLFKEAQKTMGK